MRGIVRGKDLEGYSEALVFMSARAKAQKAGLKSTPFVEGKWTTHVIGGLHTLGTSTRHRTFGEADNHQDKYPLPLASHLWAPEKEKLYFPSPFHPL